MGLQIYSSPNPAAWSKRLPELDFHSPIPGRGTIGFMQAYSRQYGIALHRFLHLKNYDKTIRKVSERRNVCPGTARGQCHPEA